MWPFASSPCSECQRLKKEIERLTVVMEWHRERHRESRTIQLMARVFQDASLTREQVQERLAAIDIVEQIKKKEKGTGLITAEEHAYWVRQK